jgi:hypothetical protein
VHWPQLSIRRVLAVCLVAVALSTFVLPYITGYGTQLFQVVVLGAWGILAAITSDAHADLHRTEVWTIALLLNALFFVIPATPIALVTRRRWPVRGAVAIAVWCVVYLSCLFILFPATDGP